MIVMMGPQGCKCPDSSNCGQCICALFHRSIKISAPHSQHISACALKHTGTHTQAHKVHTQCTYSPHTFTQCTHAHTVHTCTHRAHRHTQAHKMHTQCTHAHSAHTQTLHFQGAPRMLICSAKKHPENHQAMHQAN